MKNTECRTSPENFLPYICSPIFGNTKANCLTLCMVTLGIFLFSSRNSFMSGSSSLDSSDWLYLLFWGGDSKE